MDRKKALRQLRALKKYGGNMRLAAERWPSEFQTLIATILSARSLDETTIKVCEKELFKKYPTAQKLSKASIQDVEKRIRKINFYKNKSKNIVNCAKTLVSDFKGTPPHDVTKLVGLSGVGIKTAHVFLSEYGEPAIGVDTHVYYISHYLGWSDKKQAEKVGHDLEKLFPRPTWRIVNPIMVKFGKKYTGRKEKNVLLDTIKKIK